MYSSALSLLLPTEIKFISGRGPGCDELERQRGQKVKIRILS